MFEGFVERKKYKLKDDVSDYMLREHGFEIQLERTSTWAVKYPKDHKRMLIIKLDPPDRVIMFRYQASEKDLNLLDEIQDIKHFFKIEED